MLRRMGFRRLLPVVQLITYLLLVGPYSYESYKLASHSARPVMQIVPVQETGEFRPQYINRPTPLRVQFAVMLNLPVVVTAGLAFVPIVPEGAKGEVFWMGYLTPFIALLWYGVGLWIDQQLGWVPRKPRAFSTLRRIIWRVIFSISAGLLFVVVLLFVIVCAKIIGGTSALDRSDFGEFALIYFPVAGWACFLFVVCRQALRETKCAAITPDTKLD